MNGKHAQRQSVPTFALRTIAEARAHLVWSGRIIVGVIAAATPGAWCQDMPPQVIDRAKHATVMVGTFASEREKADTGIGSGTGYFINATGLLITNNHVIDPAHGKTLRERQKIQYTANLLSYKIIIDSGTKQERIVDCDLLYQSLTADQALLQAKDETGGKLKSPYYLPLLPPELIKKGMKVCALGFPGGNSQRKSRESNAEISLSYGAVTDVPRAPSGRVRRIETDVIARPGNSGGPMVDADGYVVGTVTLLGQSEDQANTCMLVPSALTRAFLRDAMGLKRIPDGSDLLPLLSAVGMPGERLNTPQFERLAEHDILFLGPEEQVHGNFDAEAISWSTPLGHVDIPFSNVAYTINGASGVALFFESGDYVLTPDPESKLQFSAAGGKKLEKSFGEVPVVGCKMRSGRLPDPKGELVAMETDAGHLLLADVKGTASFESLAGVNEIKLSEIARIDSATEGKQQMLTLGDGRRITGRFTGGGYSANIAATGSPIRFELSRLQRARIDRIDAGDILGGLTLLQVVAGADADLLAVARLVDEGGVKEARAKLDPWLEPARLSKLADVTQAQVRLLDGMIALRAGDADASSKLRKCIERKDERVSAYARGCVEVLKRFGTDYEGKPLSDRDVFRDAGLALGRELINKAQDLLKDRATLEGKKGEYFKYITRITTQEKAMEAAAVFAGADADDVLIELWKFAMQLCEMEYARLREEFESVRGGQNRVDINRFHKLEDIRKKSEKVADVWMVHFTELAKYGFYYSKDSGLEKLPE